MSDSSREEQYRPAYRRLRVFAVDPSLASQFDTSAINETILKIRWEVNLDGGTDGPAPGPVGEYLEVVDVDPASGAVYAPVDLNAPYLLAADGLEPSEGNPQFHQQMVYAVAMTTIAHFEQALGRVALWGVRKIRDDEGRTIDQRFVRRLRIYPHALREANAYYSPEKKALLFGYFPERANDDHETGQMVFTCLSHDIIAHETTHALLDGVHPRFAEATNEDVFALHEAFSDVVAIFQHFANPDVVRHQLARTRGDLSAPNLLGQLAQQFGKALGHRAALRDAIGGYDEQTGEWRRAVPDPSALTHTSESHARGAILLAAVFDAFLMVYESRVADLFRIAGHAGDDRARELHPDLLHRLCREASRTAHHLLQMCIRALDYCPPLDITFSDYLRALVTADHDLHPDDEYHYRVAIIEAFRRRGIVARHVRGMSEDTLLWPSGIDALRDAGYEGDVPLDPSGQGDPPAFDMRSSQERAVSALFISKKPEDSDSKISFADELWVGWDLDIDREEAWERMRKNKPIFHEWLTRGPGTIYLDAFGLYMGNDAPPSVFRSKKLGTPAVEIHSVRTAVRRGERGTLVTELVVEATQRRRGYFSRDEQRRVDAGDGPPDDEGDFKFRRGCTVLIDPQTLAVRRVIRTRGTIVDDNELERVRAFLTGERTTPSNAFDGGARLHDDHSFARLHRFG